METKAKLQADLNQVLGHERGTSAWDYLRVATKIKTQVLRQQLVSIPSFQPTFITWKKSSMSPEFYTWNQRFGTFVDDL